MRFGDSTSPGIGGLAFDDLSASDATAVAERARTELAARLPEAERAIGPIRPDPAGAVRGLEQAWTWLLGRIPRRAPNKVTAWETVDRAALPYWVWFRDGSALFTPLGPSICHDIATVDAYVIATILATQPGATLDRSATRKDHHHFRKPVVRLASGSEKIVAGLGVVRVHRVYGDKGPLRDAALSAQDFSETMSSWVQPVVATAEMDASPISVEEADEPGIDFLVHIDDTVAHQRSPMVDALVDAIAREPRVDAVHRSDREVISVRAGALTVERARERFVQLWGELDQADDPTP